VTLLNPIALAWLAVAVPVVALYFLKLKRKRLQVSSTWLWTRSVQDLRVNAPFQRLRRNLLLLLQLLLIALAAFALTQPAGRRPPPDLKRWVFLIDCSASMQMKDAAPTRLDQAKTAAKTVLTECGPDDEIMVVAFSNRAQVLTPFTDSRSAVERAIDAVRPVDSVTNVLEAFRIALTGVENAKHREIVIFSDGGFETLPGVPQGLTIRYLPFGAKPKNAAITAIDVRRPVRTGDPWTAFAQVDLFHSGKLEVPVELYVNGQLKAVKKIEMSPGSTAAIFEFAKPEPDVVEAAIAMDDDLAVDNRAWFVVKRDRAKILLATTGNFFLKNALSHVKDADAFVTTDLASQSLGEFEVVVIDELLPETALPESRYLVFGGVPKWEGIEVQGAVEQPGVVDWNRRHPAARGVNFAEIAIKSSPKLSLPGFATPIVEGPDGPLVFSWEKGRMRAIVVPFKIGESDWPLRLSFPLFLLNALSWLRDEGRSHPRPGEPLRLALGEHEREIEIVPPGGAPRKLAGEPGRDVVFGETERVGLYTVKRGEGSHGIPLNLLDPRESGGAVADKLETGTGQVGRAAPLAPPVREWWRWLAAAALALLLVEWFVYHRRVDF